MNNVSFVEDELATVIRLDIEPAKHGPIDPTLWQAKK